MSREKEISPISHERALYDYDYIVSYGYDGKGRRIWRKKAYPDSTGRPPEIEKYVYDGPNVRYDYDNDNNILRSYTALGVDGLMYVKIGGETYHYHTDHLGSVRAITDEDGNVVNRYDYDAFGNMTQACSMMDGSVPAAERKPCIPNRYTYTGREWDPDAQLYHYRARWYDPEIKRFTQEDPKRSLNPYLYVENNPVLNIDRFGDQAEGRNKKDSDVVVDLSIDAIFIGLDFYYDENISWDNFINMTYQLGLSTPGIAMYLCPEEEANPSEVPPGHITFSGGYIIGGTTISGGFYNESLAGGGGLTMPGGSLMLSIWSIDKQTTIDIYDDVKAGRGLLGNNNTGPPWDN